MVDFPEPEAPTRAAVFPALNVMDSFLTTLTEGRDGYENSTSSTSISPRTSLGRRPSSL